MMTSNDDLCVSGHVEWHKAKICVKEKPLMVWGRVEFNWGNTPVELMFCSTHRHGTIISKQADHHNMRVYVMWDTVNSCACETVLWLVSIVVHCRCRKSTESLQQQQSSQSAGQFTRTPPNPLAALDRAVRRACRLVMDQLLLDLKPFLPGLLTRPWLAQGDPTPKLCRVLERHLELYLRVRPPCRQVSDSESGLEMYCVCRG